ncbi:MAG: heavy-metal-associated domain-containing protein [bacterium]|jgi:copper chaperone
MAHSEFTVEGMTCQHCVKTVTNALQAVNGVSSALVNLDNKTAQVEYDETQTSEADLFAAVQAQDYQPVKKNP